MVLRTAAPLVGLLTLGACAPYTNVETFGPPGKSQAQLDSEANLCNRRTAYSPNHRAAYEQCMHILHNDVRLPDGTMWPGAPQYVYTPQPYTPPPYAPSPYVPEQQQGDTSSAGLVRPPPSAPSSNEGSLTPAIKQKMITEGESAVAVCGLEKLIGGEHFFKCVARHWITGMGIEVVKTMACNRRQDVIQQLPLSFETKADIVEIACS